MRALLASRGDSRDNRGECRVGGRGEGVDVAEGFPPVLKINHDDIVRKPNEREFQCK